MTVTRYSVGASDGRVIRLCAALAYVNGVDRHPDAAGRRLRALFDEFDARTPRSGWTGKALADDAVSAVELGRRSLAAAVGWQQMAVRAKRRVLAELAEALQSISPGADSGYFYDEDAMRFEWVVTAPTAPPSALVALAVSPLFDEPSALRGRVVRCAYRNCGDYFLVTGKRSGQRYCKPAHSNLERQYRHRGPGFRANRFG